MGGRLGTPGAVGIFTSFERKNFLLYISVKLAERSKASDLRSDTYQCEGSNPSLDILFLKSQVGRAVQGVRFKI